MKTDEKSPSAVGNETIPSSETPSNGAHEVFFRGLLNYIPDRIYFKDRNGRFVLVSRSEAIYLGADNPADVIGKSDFDYFESDLAKAAFADEEGVMRTGQPITGKVEEKLHLDGRKGWALVAKIPMRDLSGEIIGTCGISKDITHLKETETALNIALSAVASQKAQLEKSLTELNKTHEELKVAQQQLIDVEKVQWLARLAFGVAHEIRNPLGAISMGIDYLLTKQVITQDEQISAVIGGMSESIARADLVVSALMDGSRSAGVEVQSQEVAALVRSAVDTMKAPNEMPGFRKPPAP